jgi:peroxiredoxin
MYTHCGLLLMFSVCLSAQPAAGVTRNLAVTLSGKDADLTIHIRNEYSSPATAWILQCETPQGGSRYYWNDQELSFESKPIAPGGEIEFKFPQMPPMMKQRQAEDGSCEDFHLIAAAFADGTVTGNLAWIDAIVEDRREAYQDIAKVIGMLNDAISKETDTPAVIQQLEDMGKTAMPAAMAARPSATFGASWGNRSQGTAPPPMRPSRSPVPNAALWLVDKQAMKLPDAVKSLAEWKKRLAALPPVTETGAPSAAPKRTLTAGSFAPPSETELLGKPAPDFTLSDVDNHEVALASLRGKPVLLDFWATWCEPCREATPHIQALHDQFKDKNLVVLGIDTNEPAEKARKYFADEKYTFGNLLGSGNDVVKNYGANSIPLVVLIDKDGLVRYVHRGWGSNLDLTPEVKKLIEP